MQEEKNLMETTIFMSNPIFKAKRNMNIFGERIFKIGLANIRPHIEGQESEEYDTEFKEVIIPYSELVKMFGYKAAPDVIKKAVKDKINETVAGYIERKTENGWEDSVPLYSYIGYNPHVGLRFKFNDEWKNDLIELRKAIGFSSYKLKEVFQLSSVHSSRLMELMQMKAGYFKEGHKEIYNRLSIDFLKAVLTQEGKYKGRNDNFRRLIINQAVKEINEKTRYELSYENIKEGRKVVGYKFKMKIKEGYTEEIKETIEENEIPQKKNQRPELEQRAYDELILNGISVKVANELLSIETPENILIDITDWKTTKTGTGVLVNNIRDHKAAEKERARKQSEEKTQSNLDRYDEKIHKESNMTHEELYGQVIEGEGCPISRLSKETQETLMRLKRGY